MNRDEVRSLNLRDTLAQVRAAAGAGPFNGKFGACWPRDLQEEFRLARLAGLNEKLDDETIVLPNRRIGK